jgi:5-methylcytosine-specific restriction endonuclease McrA
MEHQKGGDMKRSKEDIVFSKLIRARAGYRCEWCGTQHESNSQGLHASHHYGRRHANTRWDTDNAAALCYKCHQKYGEDPVVGAEWLKRYLGEDEVNSLRVKAYQVKKWTKQEKIDLYAELKGRLAEYE